MTATRGGKSMLPLMRSSSRLRLLMSRLPLIEQLKPGGRMVIPVGEPVRTQYLTLVEKDDEGKIKMQKLLPVAFVPLTD